MTDVLLARIRDDDMIHIRGSDGSIVIDSRLHDMLDADALDMLITIVGDNIVRDPNLHPDSGAEVVNWAGVADDYRNATEAGS